MSFSVHFDNKKKYILILGEALTQGLDDVTLTAEKKYSINFTMARQIMGHYNGENNYLFLNSKEFSNFKAKDSEIVATPLSLGNA